MVEKENKESLKEVEEKDSEFLKRVNKLIGDFEKNNAKIPDNEIVDGKFTGNKEMVDAIEKQIIQAKAAGENIEYMRSKKAFSHTISFSGDYKPLKKLADTVDYYNENLAPVHQIYNLDKKDYEKVKKIMGDVTVSYEMPRKPRLGSTFELPITLTRKDHRILKDELSKIGVEI